MQVVQSVWHRFQGERGHRFLGIRTAQKSRQVQPYVGLRGQTRVYYNQPTTPLAHWPFRQQTTKRHEVSPEVILWIGEGIRSP